MSEDTVVMDWVASMPNLRTNVPTDWTPLRGIRLNDIIKFDREDWRLSFVKPVDRARTVIVWQRIAEAHARRIGDPLWRHEMRLWTNFTSLRSPLASCR